MSLNPPHPPLPPLNALRAFEAAARHGSFLRAAEELSVSPGAVAQQIRKLEDWAGVTLFKRHPQGVTLTPLAAQVLPRLTSGFEDLGGVARTLRQSATTRPIRIAALPAIAQLWIAPRLSSLQSSLPGYELSIHALDVRPQLTHGTFDLTLYPGETSTPDTVIAENSLIPVAAPEVARKLSKPSDLTDALLLHDTSWADDWLMWAQAHNVVGINPGRGPTFSLYSMAVERCLAGDGVLIGHTGLISHHLLSEKLVAPFPGLSLEGRPICLGHPDSDGTNHFANVISAILSASALTEPT